VKRNFILLVAVVAAVVLHASTKPKTTTRRTK